MKKLLFLLLALSLMLSVAIWAAAAPDTAEMATPPSVPILQRYARIAASLPGFDDAQPEEIPYASILEAAYFDGVSFESTENTLSVSLEALSAFTEEFLGFSLDIPAEDAIETRLGSARYDAESKCIVIDQVANPLPTLTLTALSYNTKDNIHLEVLYSYTYDTADSNGEGLDDNRLQITVADGKYRITGHIKSDKAHHSHIYQNDEYTAATCTEAGSWRGTCSCGLQREFLYAAHGHILNSTITQYASSTTPEIRTSSCDYCDYSKNTYDYTRMFTFYASFLAHMDGFDSPEDLMTQPGSVINAAIVSQFGQSYDDYVQAGTDAKSWNVPTTVMDDFTTKFFDITLDYTNLKDGVRQNILYGYNDQLQKLSIQAQFIQYSPYQVNKVTYTAEDATHFTVNAEMSADDSTWTSTFKVEYTDGKYIVTESHHPHLHYYVAKVTKEATCTETDVKTFSCVCGHSYTEEIPLVAHDTTNMTVLQEESDTSPGKYQGYCAKCGQYATVMKYDMMFDRHTAIAKNLPAFSNPQELQDELSTLLMSVCWCTPDSVCIGAGSGIAEYRIPFASLHEMTMQYFGTTYNYESLYSYVAGQDYLEWGYEDNRIKHQTVESIVTEDNVHFTITIKIEQERYNDEFIFFDRSYMFTFEVELIDGQYRFTERSEDTYFGYPVYS